MHMADAWGRLTGMPGIAMVTGGPGHANAVAALFTARGQESADGAAVRPQRDRRAGRGGFQELGQADMAKPVTKAAWAARSAATLGVELAKRSRLPCRAGPGRCI